MANIKEVIKQDLIIQKKINKIKKKGRTISSNMRPILQEVYILNNIVANALKKKMCPTEYDEILDISSKWDTILAYCNTGTGNWKIPYDKCHHIPITKKNDNRQKFRAKVIKHGCMNKTITVEKERIIKHKQTGKYIKSKKRILVHDEKEIGRKGDTVVIAECRPISKLKRYRLIKRIYF